VPDAYCAATLFTSAQVDVPMPDLSRFNQLLSGPLDDSPVDVFFA
jgi:hypothetical protein